jgi:ParB family chromosome partitioning protein
MTAKRQEKLVYLLLVTLLPDPNQPRKTFSQEELFELSQSLAKHGFLHPLRVRKIGEDSYIIVDGQRRWMAAKMLGHAEAPCIVESDEVDDTLAFERALIANCLREDLKPLEEARAFERLMREKNWTGEQLAAEIQISPSKVSRALKLLTLPLDLQERVEKGFLSPAKAYELSKAAPAVMRELAGRAEDMTRDEIVGAIKSNGQSKGEPVKRVTAKLPEGRAVTVQGSIETLDDLIAILEETLTRARKSRPSGVSVATFIRMLADAAKA